MFEHTFWLQVFRDHATFIHDSFTPSHKKDTAIAKYFIDVFTDLLHEVELLHSSNAISFAKEAEDITSDLKRYKLSIIKRQLNGELTFHLTPTFVNHMTYELEEYEHLLRYLKNGETPPAFHELHHHLLWLRISATHAKMINECLDHVEVKLKEQCEQYRKIFEHFYLRAVELNGYLRINMETFPALIKFNHDVKAEINDFQKLILDILTRKEVEHTPDNFTFLLAKHIEREGQYYIKKIFQTAN